MQKSTHNKETKYENYIFGKKILLDNKYIKIKSNYKLKIKNFGFFQVLHLVNNQAYKLKLLK